VKFASNAIMNDTPKTYKSVSIIGDGAMATVCSMILASNGVDVKIWGHDKGQLRQFEQNRENVRFLPGYKIPDASQCCYEYEDACTACDLVLSAVPCQYVRGVFKRLKPHYPAGLGIVSVAKGIENSTLLLPTQVIRQVLESTEDIGVLSGPTIADELAQNLPASACAAGSSEVFARRVQQTFSTPHFRVYYNHDVMGVELAGALKNVIAIAAGIIDGLKLGDNAKAALVARGIVEISRLGRELGAENDTFYGLSGVGDLITTCISPKGRNRSFGQRLGSGMSAKDALAATNSVVEGVATCESVSQLAEKVNVDMPIINAVYNVIHGRMNIQQALEELMQRELKPE
jgi:glycerol-3-phosphate dehydrogenase (NAD(P)+)